MPGEVLTQVGEIAVGPGSVIEQCSAVSVPSLLSPGGLAQWSTEGHSRNNGTWGSAAIPNTPQSRFQGRKSDAEPAKELKLL